MTKYNRSTTITLVILPLFLSWVHSQIGYEPFSEEKAEKEYYIQRTLQPPAIDGSFNDSCWMQIIPITDFVQEDPNNMAEPTEKTEVYLTYNDRSLFIFARLYDSAPKEIVRQLAPRDDWYGAFDEMADYFSFDIDSRHDHQTSFSFAVNASGVLSDEMVYRDGEFDSDWNAIWEAEVQIDDFGWNVEMEIPFSNLSFFDDDELIWGMNCTRFIQRKYETITWVAFPIDVEGIVSKYGHLHGLKGIYPPSKFEFKPYFQTGLTNFSDIRLMDYEEPKSWGLNYNDKSRNNLGMDIEYRLSTDSRLTFTINPDYGQIEADPAEINLTAFETYLMEKRPFFLKDIDIFETPLEIFYSRRIGEKAWGEGMTISENTSNANNDTLYHDIPVIIKAASKFTGKTHEGLSYGILGAVTTLDDSSGLGNQLINGKNRNYVISRIKQDLFAGNSFIGFMSTSSLSDSTHTFSIDGMANILDNQIGLDGQIIMTSDEYKGIYSSISFSPLGLFSGWIDYYQYDKNLNFNNLGYLWRNNYSQKKIGLKFQTMEPWHFVRRGTVIIEGDMEQNIDGLDLGKTIELSYDLEFDNFWAVGGGCYKIMAHYDDRKIILDYSQNEFGPSIFIPEILGAHLNISTDKHQVLWANLALTSASNTRNDVERGLYAELIYNPNPYVSFSASYDNYRLTKQYHWLESFFEHDGIHHIFSDLQREIDVLTFRVNSNISRKFNLQGYLELFSNHDMFDATSYSEYDATINDYKQTSYILGGWEDKEGQVMGSIYSQDITELAEELSYIDPSLYIGLYPKYTSIIFNGIAKWNYMKGSNIYFVYSLNKSVNGKPFRRFRELKDFLLLNNKLDWVEILRDQTFMIKIDYWFEI